MEILWSTFRKMKKVKKVCKGGEAYGHSKNIDMQMGNKFNAFKQYAEKYKLHWGFVRDIDDELYINNTEFVDDMSDDMWKPLEEEL